MCLVHYLWKKRKRERESETTFYRVLSHTDDDYDNDNDDDDDDFDDLFARFECNQCDDDGDFSISDNIVPIWLSFGQTLTQSIFLSFIIIIM